MIHTFEIDVTSPLGTQRLSAFVLLDDESVHPVRLDDEGRATVDLPAAPKGIRLDANSVAAPPPAAPPPTVPPRPSPGDAKPVDVRAIFDTYVPVNGLRAALQLTWGGHCHGEHHHAVEGGRFNAWEHIQCAWYVGRTAAFPTAPEIQGAPVPIAYNTPLPLTDATATFGEVICLAGDYFAHLDAESAALFADAWPPMTGLAAWLAGADYRAARLREEPGDRVRSLLDTIHSAAGEQQAVALEFVGGAVDAIANGYPLRRYLTLASQNYCHFGSPDPDLIPNEALRLYRGYHALAMSRARAAADDAEAWLVAVLTESFACHFLTDLFASGHMRTPRRALGERFGVMRGSLSMSMSMHDEDNARGLWCSAQSPTGSGQDVWRAYGDGRLLSEESTVHLGQVQEAVRLSVAELYEANAGREVPEEKRAERRIPVPLAPGVGPATVGRVLDAESLGRESANHWPLYKLLPNGHVSKRRGDPESSVYDDLEASLA